MNSETTKVLQDKNSGLVHLARKLALEKNYEQAIKVYKQGMTLFIDAAKKANNQQKTELIKKVVKKMWEEMKKVEKFGKSNGKEQVGKELGQEEDDQKKYFENEDNILADLENALQNDNSGPTKQEEETKLGDASKFKHCHYPNANEYKISLIHDLEKKDVIEPDTDIRLDNIASLGDSQKLALKEYIVLPLLYPQFFTGGRFCNRVLFAGPHTEKMRIIHALARESKARLLIFSVSDLVSKWPYQDEKVLRVIFEMGSYYAPSIIYLEGIEAFANAPDPEYDERRRRMKTEFLIQCQGLYSSSFEVENPETKAKEYKPFMVIGSSERPMALDGAIRRRFERRIYLNLLNKDDRRKFFQIYLEQSNAKIGEDVNWEYIVKHTEYYSPDDIASICREAIMASKRIKVKEVAHSDKEIKELNKNKPEESIVTHKDFTEALRRIRRSILDSELEFYHGNIG